MKTHNSTPRAERLVDELTLEEQISLMSGEDFWNVGAIERLGIGALRVTDGPNGARGGGSLNGGTHSAAFPVGIAIGATWNPELVEKIGAAIALETREKGASVLLGPTINIQRGPLNGRNFECYSEDPILTGYLAAAYVTGLQAQGVAATLKHFIANESEIRRTVNSSDVDERTLRELYLVPFEMAIKQANAWAVMTSYNRINGTYAADNKWLISEVLRNDWGFDGLVMSDWFGLRSTKEGAIAGLDLEMPGPALVRGNKLLELVQSGDVPADMIRAAALNVLRLLERTGDLDNMDERTEIENERDETRSLIREAGVQSAVLLKNLDALPLEGEMKIAVVGPNAKTARVMGGGSAQLNAYRRVSPWDGLVDALGEDTLTFAQGCRNDRFEPIIEGTFTRAWFTNDALDGEPFKTEEIAALEHFGSAPVEGVDPHNHSSRTTGTWTAPRDGTFRFGFHCTGKGRLFLNDKLMAEAWDSWERGRTLFEEGCDPVTADITVKEGETVDIRFEFATKPNFDLFFHAHQVGVGRVLGMDDIEEAVEVAAAADVAIVCVGRTAEWDTEGWDLPDMTLPGIQNDLVSAVAAKAHKTIVLLQTGGPVEMPWLDQVDAVLECWYPGQEAGYAIADVILGKRSPSGKLPQTFPVKLDDAPTFSGTPQRTYPGEDGHVEYAEKLEIGYRHHSGDGPAPLFPFGFGLSYTTFSLGAPEAALDDTGAGSVTLPVTNTGERKGSEVVQLYIAPQTASVDRPAMELKGFAKLALAGGMTDMAKITLSPRDFAYFDAGSQSWKVDAGEYTLRIGTSAAEIAHEVTVSVTAQTLPV
ncbi:beta-glucosidase [Marivivens aquimaris]|uniref:beta-glucosidase n=1 Tax=Marivivens aquimaris TaxID=2774876 RepID=UPI00187E11AA|nr:glycoside hydrolase family 3 C-terminal domain-containing protein [Marivivens aquimaris]